MSYEDPLPASRSRGPRRSRRSASLREAFPDLRIERTAPALGDEHYACLPWRALGTQTRRPGRAPGSDRFVTLHGLHYVELTDGRVHRARGFFDLYDGGVQLGLLPRKRRPGRDRPLLLRGFGLRR